MRPVCYWLGHDWHNPVTFKPYFPPYQLRGYFDEPVDTEMSKMEAFAAQGCRYRGCNAFRVLNYAGQVVEKDTDEWAKAAGVLGL